MAVPSKLKCVQDTYCLPSSQSPRLDSTAQCTALSFVGAAAWISSTALPYQISMLALRPGVGLAKSSFISSAELLVFAGAAIATGGLMRRFNSKALLLTGLTVSLVACFISIIYVNALTVLVFTRLVFGAGTGIIGATSFALATKHPTPERMYAYMAVAVTPSFAFIVFAVPAALARWGSAGLYIIELITLLALAPASWLLHSFDLSAPNSGKTTKTKARGSFLLLGGLLLFFVNQGLVWGLAEEAASAVGLFGARLSFVFSAGAILYLVGAMGASFLGLRTGFRTPLVIGYVTLCLITFAVFGAHSSGALTVGLALFSAVTAFTLPYLQGLLALLPDNGRSSALGSAAISFGGAIGPFVGGLFAAASGMNAVAGAGLLLLVGSSIAVLIGGHVAIRNADLAKR